MSSINITIIKQTASQFAVAQYKSVVGAIEQQVPLGEDCFTEIGCGRGELLDLLSSSLHKNLRGFDVAAFAVTDPVSNVCWNGSTLRYGETICYLRAIRLKRFQNQMPLLILWGGLSIKMGAFIVELRMPLNCKAIKVFSPCIVSTQIYFVLSTAKRYARNGIFVEK